MPPSGAGRSASPAAVSPTALDRSARTETVDLLAVDASVVVQWFLPERHSEAALRIAVSDSRFLAPDLLGAEIANTFWRKLRRQEITAEEAAGLLDDFRRLDITMSPHRPLLPAALALAIISGHPVYDCLYLALADQSDCKLVTADRPFYEAFVQGEWGNRMMCIEDW